MNKPFTQLYHITHFISLDCKTIITKWRHYNYHFNFRIMIVQTLIDFYCHAQH